MKAKNLYISLLLIAFACSLNLNAQEEKHLREQRPFGASLNLGGPSFFASASIDYFINPVIQLETGIGLVGYFGGLKFHYSKQENPGASIYTGAFISRLKMYSVGSLSGIYAPLGWQNISEYGFTYGIEAAVWHGFQQTTFIWGALRMGWHF